MKQVINGVDVLTPAVINNGVWSAQITLPQTGLNVYWVIATPTDVDNCATITLDGYVTYNPEVCPQGDSDGDGVCDPVDNCV